jgi:hypothetical protein
MATFGEIIVGMIYTIISSIVNTTIAVLGGLFQMFRILHANLGNLSPLAIFIAILILSLIIYALFRIFKGQVKIFIFAVAVLVIITLITLLAL